MGGGKSKKGGLGVGNSVKGGLCVVNTLKDELEVGDLMERDVMVGEVGEVGEVGVSEFIDGGLRVREQEGLAVGGKCVNVFASMRSSLVSSRSLSCKRWLLARFDTRWKGNGRSKRRSSKERTLEQATNVNPVENSFFPMLMTTLSSVRS